MMDSEKAEDLLILSLDANTAELRDNSVLSVGIEQDGRWEIIVKYHGDILQYEDAQTDIELLQFGFAIVTLPQNRIGEFLSHTEVEFAEKPKELYEQDIIGNLASCMNTGELFFDTLNERTAESQDLPVNQLTGKGVCIAIIDSGLDVTLPCFQNPDGTSRVLFFYDQRTKEEYSNAFINAELEKARNAETVSDINWDLTGHGTRVAVIATGNGRSQDGTINRQLIGAAPESDIMVVKLDTSNQRSFPLTTTIMRAFDYIQRKSIEIGIPTVINLSFGNSYGPHDGTSLLENYIDGVAQSGRFSICVGTGNEGSAGGHAGGQIRPSELFKSIFFNIGYYERECNLQMWFLAVDQYVISLISPNGEQFTFETEMVRGRSIRTKLQNTDILLYIGTAQPYSMKRELFILFSGNRDISAGTWELRLRTVFIKSGNYNLYLPSSKKRSRDTVFLQPSPDLTITIPATAKRVISVGAYNIDLRSYAEFSGRGFVAKADENNMFIVKPELVAPGVGILTETQDGTERVNGTSFSTPFVSGAVARLMQWGIVNGQDPYLYGEKCKAYLAQRARRLPEDAEEINGKTGFGALCVG